jgi:hypothetical protein
LACGNADFAGSAAKPLIFRASRGGGGALSTKLSTEAVKICKELQKQ